MSEFGENIVHAPPSEIKGGGSSSSEKEKFEPTFLVESQEEIDRIRHKGLQRRIRALHITAVADPQGRMFGADKWSEEFLGIQKRMIEPQEGEDTYDPEETLDFLIRINERVKELDKDTPILSKSKIENDEYGTPEVPDSYRPFSEIRADLKYFVDNPSEDTTSDDRTLAEVHREHKQLAEIAKDVGIFDGIRGQFEGIKAAVNATQEANIGNFEETYKQVAALNPQEFEDKAKTQLHGWNDKFDGLIGAYHTAVKANMGLAWEIANDRSDSSTAEMFRNSARVWNYDTPPEARILDLANAHSELVRRRAEEERRISQGLTPQNLLLQRFVESLESTNVPPTEQRKQFLEIEEFGIGEVQVPLTTAVIFKDLTPKEKTVWQARIALSNARSLRQAANIPADLFPNDHIQKMTNGELKALDEVKGVVEAEEIYLIMTTELDCTNIDGANGPLGKIFRDFKVKRTVTRNGVERMLTTNIKNFHDIKNQGELVKFRGIFRKYLQMRFGLSEEQARDAEQIGFNKFIMSDINEYASSADFERHNSRPTRVRPKTMEVYSVLINPAQRDLMHPLEKALDDNRQRKAPRSWPPNELGSFITSHPSYGPDKIPLPYTLSKKSHSYYHDFDIILPGGQQTTLYKQMRRDGMRLIRGNNPNDRAERVDWDSRQGENPYIGYYLTKNKQLFVWNVINDGALPRDKTMADLKNRLNDLDVDDDFRETIVYLIDPVAKEKLEPTNPEFKPYWGIMATATGISEAAFWDSFIKQHPGFFREKHTQVSKWGKMLGV